MFNIGWSELLLIGIVALIAIGPKELPGVLRMVGQWMGKARRMASEFQGQFQEALREAELAETAKELKSFADAASGDLETGLNSLTQIEDKSEKPAGGDTPAESDAPNQPREGDSTDDRPAASEEFVVTPAPKGTHPAWARDDAPDAEQAGPAAKDDPATKPADASFGTDAERPAPRAGEKAAG